MKWKGLSADGLTITLHKFTGNFNLPVDPLLTAPSALGGLASSLASSVVSSLGSSAASAASPVQTEEALQAEFPGLLGGSSASSLTHGPFSALAQPQSAAAATGLYPDPGAEFAYGATTDVETTGLDVKIENVIEIGIRVFRYHKATGKMVAVVDAYSALQDPGRPLAPVIQELTGLTDEALKGQRIDWQRVAAIFQQCEIIVAHNAAFDRPFIEKELGFSTQKIWACSLKQVDWAAKGYGTRSLEILCAYHGFFADAHRALTDSDALLHLLSTRDEKTGECYFAELLATSSRQQGRFIASGAPFEAKTILRDRGYRWDTQIRAWTKYLPLDQAPMEVKWLEDEVYLGAFRGEIKEIPLTQQFS